MRKYKCPYCNNRYEKSSLITHVNKMHNELIPEGFTAARVVFNSINHKTVGHCVVCGNETEWNEDTYKYNRLCSNPNCRKALRDIARHNMIKVYGKESLLDDPMQQEKMLKNRSISGTYRFSDGTKFTYTGSYEKQAIEYMDKVLKLKSKDIVMPGPIIDYIDKNGAERKWITDIFYIPFNLIIEVKDGGSNPNNRVMTEYRDKQVSKEIALYKLGQYNYLRLTNNNFFQLMAVLMIIKNRLDANNTDKLVGSDNIVFSVNESKSNNDLSSIIKEFKSFKDSIINEEKLSTSDRKELDSSEFGLPKERKYPLTDENHVISALRFFNSCDADKKKTLAKNILKAIKKFNMTISKDSEIYKYL